MTLNELKCKDDLDFSILSERLLLKRTDRPDEWSMDELAWMALKIDQIEGLRKAERCIKTLIEACKDSEARTERAEARVKELEFKLHLLSDKTKAKIMEKL